MLGERVVPGRRMVPEVVEEKVGWEEVKPELCEEKDGVRLPRAPIGGGVVTMVGCRVGGGLDDVEAAEEVTARPS